MNPTTQEIRNNLVSAAQGKKLLDTSDPAFFSAPWEQRSNGAMVSLIFTWTPEKGPIGAPVVWMSHFEETQQERLDRAIKETKETIASWNQSPPIRL